jgi:hypothetical protein
MKSMIGWLSNARSHTINPMIPLRHAMLDVSRTLTMDLNGEQRFQIGTDRGMASWTISLHFPTVHRVAGLPEMREIC